MKCLKSALTATTKYIALIIIASICIFKATAADKPWDHGRLQPTADGAFLCHADGTPFFWLGDTGWLLPEKLDRPKAAGYLQASADAGYNVVQVQVLNDVPSVNAYGQLSNIDGWNFSDIDRPGVYGYWDHMDYIIDEAARQGIYIGMVCIWGGLVKGGKLDADQACAYGRFLAERYRDRPNVIWIIGGDIRGDVKTDVWEALASTIKANDSNHLMTFHPFGRTSSVRWWADAPWIDMHMFQSGHRAYDQTRGDGDDKVSAAVAEDNWRYVAEALATTPRRPVIDGEPSYEGIPHGLHDTSLPRWQPEDARRYAYWSVFAGAAGHTYGHNSVMQMLEPGQSAAYGGGVPWYEAVKGGAYVQMKYLKDLMLSVSYFDRVPDQSVIVSEEGFRYDRAIATRGNDYILVYTYTNSPMTIDLDRIAGAKKHAWWMDPATGVRTYIGEFKSRPTQFQNPAKPNAPGNDCVLIIRNKK